jgi:hypothetical protein
VSRTLCRLQGIIGVGGRVDDRCQLLLQIAIGATARHFTYESRLMVSEEYSG